MATKIFINSRTILFNYWSISEWNRLYQSHTFYTWTFGWTLLSR